MTKGARKSYSPESKAQAILELLKEQTSLSERASVYEVHPTLLTRWRKEALANLPKIFEDPRRKVQDEKDSLIKDLYSQVGRLTMELEWLGKNGVAPLPRRERVTLLDRGEDSLLSLAAQADLPGLNRSGLYDKPRSPSGEDLRLKCRIDELFTEHPFYGARRIAAVLNGEGLHVRRKRV